VGPIVDEEAEAVAGGGGALVVGSGSTADGLGQEVIGVRLGTLRAVVRERNGVVERKGGDGGIRSRLNLAWQ
jgi:hypothetical protein